MPLLRHLKASITLLAAVDAEDPATLRDPREISDPAALAELQAAVDRAERATKSAIGYLKGVESTIAGPNEITLRVGYGEAAEAIIEVVESENADLVVMATRRESTLMRGIIGSTTSRVLHHVGRPVLVVRVEEDGQPLTPKWPQNIITPVDVTPMSELAVDASIALAKASGADIRFVRVTPRVYYPASSGALEYASSGIFFGSELRVEAFEYLAPFVDRARAEGVDAYAEARSGSAAGEIVDMARELPDSLVVMTTHAREGFLRMTLGSTADKVVRASARPVLLLPVNQLEE
jgi:nucleotide-binding universal stress UspA family protein